MGGNNAVTNPSQHLNRSSDVIPSALLLLPLPKPKLPREVPKCQAAYEDDVHKVRHLILANGGNVNVQDERRCGNLRIVRYLLDGHSANMSIRNKFCCPEEGCWLSGSRDNTLLKHPSLPVELQEHLFNIILRVNRLVN